MEVLNQTASLIDFQTPSYNTFPWWAWGHKVASSGANISLLYPCGTSQTPEGRIGLHSEISFRNITQNFLHSPIQLSKYYTSFYYQFWLAGSGYLIPFILLLTTFCRVPDVNQKSIYTMITRQWGVICRRQTSRSGVITCWRFTISSKGNDLIICGDINAVRMASCSLWKEAGMV